MEKTLRKYIQLNYLYYMLPFLTCVICGILLFDFRSLQMLVNSFYQSPFCIFVFYGLLTTFPSFTKLVYYSNKVDELSDLLETPAAMCEAFGECGGGKTSSALLRGLVMAEKIQSKIENAYNFAKANRDRWSKHDPKKLKNFAQLEKSYTFWEENSEYIPYFASTVEVVLPDGRKSFMLTREHLEQRKWLPYCFMVIDEGGLLMPQDEWKDRPEDIVLFMRFCRQFGYSGIVLEQKKDGILINARAVLGGTYLCIGQRNALRPHLLLDIIDKLVGRLPRSNNPERLGLLIEKLKSFADKLGFRIWDQVFFKTLEFQQYKPPVQMKIVCTNSLPFFYDSEAFADLYLAKDLPAELSSMPDSGITKDSEIGKLLLRSHYKAEEIRAKKADEEALKAKKRANQHAKEDARRKKYEEKEKKEQEK